MGKFEDSEIPSLTLKKLDFLNTFPNVLVSDCYSTIPAPELKPASRTPS